MESGVCFGYLPIFESEYLLLWGKTRHALLFLLSVALFDFFSLHSLFNTCYFLLSLF